MARFNSLGTGRTWGVWNLAGCLSVLGLLLLPALVGCEMPGTTALYELRREVGKLAEAVATKQELATAENSSAAACRELGSHIGQVETRVNQIDTRMNLLATKIEQQQNPTATFKLPASASPPPALQPSHSSLGTVQIENRMATWQYLEINGDATGIAPLSRVNIYVPADTATTRLVGYETTKTWWVGAPDYFQKVIISPKPDDQWIARNP